MSPAPWLTQKLKHACAADWLLKSLQLRTSALQGHGPVTTLVAVGMGVLVRVGVGVKVANGLMVGVVVGVGDAVTAGAAGTLITTGK